MSIHMKKTCRSVSIVNRPVRINVFITSSIVKMSQVKGNLSIQLETDVFALLL